MKKPVQILLINSIFVACLVLSGCGTASTPYATDPQVASFSGNDQNSGIVQFMPDGSLEITPGAWTRYNAYVEKYGHRLLPEVKKNFGCEKLPSGNWKMTREAADKWHRMIEMKKRDDITGGSSK